MITRRLEHSSVRTLHEVLFSLSVGLAITGTVAAGTNSTLLWPIVQLKEILSGSITRPGRLVLASAMAFLFTATLCAACIFLLLRAFARYHYLQALHRSIVGIVVLAIPWICWWLMVPGHSPYAYIGLATETTLVIWWVLTLDLKELTWWHGLMLAAHYGLWSWLFWRFVPTLVVLSIPGLAGFSCVVWMFSIRPNFTGLSDSHQLHIRRRRTPDQDHIR